MGKQIKIVSSDPILSKNFKYEKRRKERLDEKAKNEEQRQKQAQQRKEMIDIQSRVDAKIQNITAKLGKLAKSSKIDKLKEQMLHKSEKKVVKQGKISTTIPELHLSTMQQKIDCYSFHFQIKINQSDIITEKKKLYTQQIQEKTRQEIREMFGADQKEQQAPQAEIEQKDEIINLSLDCKKQSDVKLGSSVYHVSKNFMKNNHILTKNTLQLDDQALQVSKNVIDGYFDHVFIQNSQEQKIENFRKIVIDHSVAHLQRSLEEERGRGFTNCKVLILTPFVGDAKAILELIEQKFPEHEVGNKDKLQEIQDQNDFFRIGLKIVKKKKQLNYFSHFDHSQIIIASPVGLKSIIGSEGDSKRQNSFISSVEIVYIDRASVFLMQNWIHLAQIFNNLNIMPKYDSLKNSIDTIRESFLELKGRLFRQTIVFSQFNFPELNGLKKNHFQNVQGCLTSKIYYQKPSIQSKFEQHFYKIEVKNPKDDLQLRFQYFKKKFWDDLHNKQSFTKVVLFVSSYFEYVKLKTFLQRVNASAQYICEHTSKNKVQSKVAKFNSGQYRILLMTERAFYFQICQIKKFHRIYFYSLPKNLFVYEQLLNSIVQDENNSNKIVSIYTKFDYLTIQRLVGTSKALEMVRQFCNNVSFVI